MGVSTMPCEICHFINNRSSSTNWGLVCWEATPPTRLVWSPESCVAAARQCSCARVVRWRAKVASNLTDVWQQLFEQQDITVICTIHFHSWLHENHTSAPESGNTYWNRYTRLSETSEWRQWAEAASDWNVVRNQQSYIDQATDQWQDYNACVKAKSKHWTVSIVSP